MHLRQRPSRASRISFLSVPSSLSLSRRCLISHNGGNALGISSDEGPLICTSSIAYLRQHSALHSQPPVLKLILVYAVSTQWSASEDDEVVYRIAQTILNKAMALAKSKGLVHQYIYQNYASSSQDVFGSYGAKNKVRLLQTQELYDPDRIFVDLQPGYFKLRPSAIGLHVQLRLREKGRRISACLYRVKAFCASF